LQRFALQGANLLAQSLVPSPIALALALETLEVLPLQLDHFQNWSRHPHHRRDELHNKATDCECSKGSDRTLGAFERMILGLMSLALFIKPWIIQAVCGTFKPSFLSEILHHHLAAGEQLRSTYTEF
jgi:hypothetical protein